MKPTQQEIIELAREAGITTINNGYHPVSAFTAEQLERLVHLALERYGADGGEPVAWIDEFGNVYPIAARRKKSWVNAYQHNWRPLYTHPSPTELQAEYERGLEDAAKVADDDDHIVDGRGYHDQLGDAKSTATNIREAIRALKGKQ